MAGIIHLSTDILNSARQLLTRLATDISQDYDPHPAPTTRNGPTLDDSYRRKIMYIDENIRRIYVMGVSVVVWPLIKGFSVTYKEKQYPKKYVMELGNLTLGQQFATCWREC